MKYSCVKKKKKTHTHIHREQVKTENEKGKHWALWDNEKTLTL